MTETNSSHMHKCLHPCRCTQEREIYCVDCAIERGPRVGRMDAAGREIFLPDPIAAARIFAHRFPGRDMPTVPHWSMKRRSAMNMGRMPS